MGDLAPTPAALAPGALAPAVGEYGEEAAFARLCEEALPRVYAFVRAQVTTRAIAEEVTARVFLKACELRTALPAGESAVFWLFRTARTTLIDHWRVEGRREATAVHVDELELRSDAARDPEAALLMKERVAACLRFVNRLEEPDRTVVLLKFAAQRTNREIAGILELSPGAVGMRLLRAMRFLRERLKEVGA